MQYELVQRVRAAVPTAAELALAEAGADGSLPIPLPTESASAEEASAAESAASGASCCGVSCLTLALQLQDMEERIPWEMVRDASSGCDWSVVRPVWLAAVEEGRHELKCLTMALATLEAALAEKALAKGWRGADRAAWLEALLLAPSAMALRELLSQLERHVQWNEYEDSGEEGEEEEEEEEPRGKKANGRPDSAAAGKRSPISGGGNIGGGSTEGVKRARREEAETSAAEVEAEVSRLTPSPDASASKDHKDAFKEKEPEDAKDKDSASKESAKKKEKRRRESAEEEEHGVSGRTRHSRMQDEMIQRALEGVGSGGSFGGSAEAADDDGDGDGADAAGEEGGGGDLTCVEEFLAYASRLKRAVYGPPSSRNSASAALAQGGASQPLLAGREASVRGERVEADFWRAVAGGGAEQRLEGAADVDVTLTYTATALGSSNTTSGFARPEEALLAAGEPYAASPWSPHNLPTLPGALFSHLLNGGPQPNGTGKASGRAARGAVSESGSDSPSLDASAPSGLRGLVSPRMQLGMLWSVDSPAVAPRWGVQPSLLYGASYLLAGAPKTWYALPPADADAFEALLKREYRGTPSGAFGAGPTAAAGMGDGGALAAAAAELGASAPPVLVPPSLLATAQLQVCRVEQQPGEIVITSPRCYHFGLSHGTTISESTVFATDDWLSFGWLAHTSAKRAATATAAADGSGAAPVAADAASDGSSSPAFAFEELVLRAACAEPSVRASANLLEALRPMAAAHAAALEALRRAGATVIEAPPAGAVAAPKLQGGDAGMAEEEAALSALLACAPPWLGPTQPGASSAKWPVAEASCAACSVCAQPCYLAIVRCTACSSPRVACAEHGLSLGCGCGAGCLAATVAFPPKLIARFDALLEKRVARRTLWLAAAAAALAGRPTLEAAAALLVEAEAMQLKEEAPVGSLAARKTEGDRWAARAAAMLEGGRRFTLVALAAHLAAGEALPLSLPQLAALRAAAAEATEWEARAEAALAPAHGRSPGAASSTGGGRWDPSLARSEAELRALLSDPAAAVLQLPLAYQLEDEICRLAWVRSASTVVSSEPELGDLKELLAEGERLRVTHLPDALSLAKRCTAASRWAQRANNSLRRRSYLAAFESLAAEGSTLRVGTEQLREVEGRIGAATSWAARARAALGLDAECAEGAAGKSGRGLASVEEVRALAAEAAALDVTVAEEAQVADLVKSVDWWSKRAAGMFLKRGCEASLLELLTHRKEKPPLEATADGDGGEGSGSTACAFCTGNDAATTSKFMIGCDGCDRWYHGPCVGVDKKVADAMTEYTCLFCAEARGEAYAYGPPCPVPKRTRRPRLRQVAALLDEAAKIKMKMPEVEPMRSLLLESESWQADAAGLLEDGSDGLTGGDSSATNGGASGAGGMERANQTSGPPKLRHDQVESFLVSGEACEVEPEALTSLRKLGAQFGAWQARALAVLGGEYKTDEPLGSLEEKVERQLIGEEAEDDEEEEEPQSPADVEVGEAGARPPPQEDKATKAPGRRRVGGGKLDKLDRAALRGVAPNSLGGLHLLLLEADELRITSPEVSRLEEMAAAARRWRKAAREALAEEAPSESAVGALLSQLDTLPLRLRERAELQQKLAAQRWLLVRRVELAEALAGGRPSLDLLAELVAEARALGLEGIDEVRDAEERVAKAGVWAEKAAEALRNRASMGALRALLEEASALGAAPANEGDLRRRVDNSASWSARAAAAVDEVTTEEDLADLLAQAEEAPVPSADKDPLVDKAAVAQWWRERAAAAFVKEGCRFGLAECLRGDGHFELATADGGWAAHLACSFCTGQSRFETAQFMIGCDGCDRWYHGPCVGVSKAQGDAMSEFTCPTCAGAKAVAYKFGPPTPVPRKTKRPRRAHVAALLAEAVAVGVTMAEEAMLRDLLREADAWDVEAAALLDASHGAPAPPAEAEGSNGGEHAACADLEAVRALVQKAERLEVAPERLTEVRAARERLENWQRNWELLHQTAAKATGRGGVTAGSMAPCTSFDAHGFLSAGAFPGDAAAIGASLDAEASALGLAHAELLASLRTCGEWRAHAQQALRSGADTPSLASLCGVTHLVCSPEAELLRTALVRSQALVQLLDPADVAAVAANAAASAADAESAISAATVAAAAAAASAAAAAAVAAASAPAPPPPQQHFARPPLSTQGSFSSQGSFVSSALPPPYQPAPAPYVVDGPTLPPTAPSPVLMGLVSAGFAAPHYAAPAAVPATPVTAGAEAGLLDGGDSLMTEEEL